MQKRIDDFQKNIGQALVNNLNNATKDRKPLDAIEQSLGGPTDHPLAPLIIEGIRDPLFAVILARCFRGKLKKMTRSASFAERERRRQLAWAIAGHIPTTALEIRHGVMSAVLLPEHQRLNLFDPHWWDYIEKAEHRWARALNSSQCFAINLFGHLRTNPAASKHFLRQWLPHRSILDEDVVSVEFEYTPPQIRQWLGERRQPTQVDVYFLVERAGAPAGHALVEVKYTEAEFGRCRGWKMQLKLEKDTFVLSKCRNAKDITKNPEDNCWLVSNEGRHYWSAMAQPGARIDLASVGRSGACPFRFGLYQLMRNRVLADQLALHHGGWADVAVCRHPLNDIVTVAQGDDGTTYNVFEEFLRISSHSAIFDWNAEDVARAITALPSAPAGLSEWIETRYFPT